MGEKTLYLIGGPMGAGKTTVCRELQKRLPKNVFLDGDWCWDASPFAVTEETKEMALDNVCHLLSNFLRCSAYENVIFCWVMHEQSILDRIFSALGGIPHRTVCVTLVCSEETLLRRLEKDVRAGLRTPDVAARALDRLQKCAALDTRKADTEGKSPEEIAAEIAAFV